MSQAGYTPIQLYYSATASAAPSAGNLANGELAVNITDGKLFYKDNGGVVRVLATAAGAAGDVVGPGSSTDNALVRFDGTTGKLVQSSVGILSDAGALSGLTSVAATTFTGALTGNASTAITLQTSRTIWGQSFDGSANVTGALTGVTDLTASGSLTLNGGTANGVAYLNGSKVLTSGSALTFDGAILGVNGVSVGRGGGAVSTNTVVGSGALNANTSGAYNAAFGQSSLAANTTGSNNTAVGHGALYLTTTASSNVAVGVGAGYNTTVNYGTFLGVNAGYGNTTGIGNVCVGFTAGNNVTTGSGNTFVGSGNPGLVNAAGYFITTGSNNTIVGAYNGNSGILDIRTANNYAILSDGSGNRQITTAEGKTLALGGTAVSQVGTGVTFPANQNASSDASTLDDYEEGAWTPALADCGAPTYTEKYGRYIKIGRQVTIVMKIAVTGATLTGNRMLLTGLPFTAQDPADAAQRVASRIQGDWQAMGAYAGSSGMFRIDSGARLEGVRDNGGGYSVYWLYSELASTSFEFALSMTYFTEN